MRDLITGAVRTAVQGLATLVVAWLVQINVNIDADALNAVLFPVALGVVTIVLNWLQAKFPWLAKVFSLGLSKATPSY